MPLSFAVPMFRNPRASSEKQLSNLIGAALLLGVGLVAFEPLPARADSDALTALGSLGGTSGGCESGCNNLNISPDGSVVVGDAIISGNVIDHAFRWTQAGGMTDLGALGGDPANTNSSTTATSTDGSILAGYSFTNDSNTYTHAFRWTQAGGMTDLGTLGGDPANTNSSALGISADGSVVAGQSSTDDTNAINHAFRWTQATGMSDLGALGIDPANTSSSASGISADGSTVVGYSYTNDTNTFTHAFRWTQAAGMSDLGALGIDSANTNSGALGVSATGKIIVGYSYIDDTNTSFHAFRWTQATGMQDLNTLLGNAGVNLTGVTLTSANAVSANGEYITGIGLFSGITEAYLVYYNDGTTDGLITATDVQNSTESLSADQRAALAESHATAGQLLGMTRPVDSSSYTYAGGMFGSALGYTGGQYSKRGVTVLGGIAYGSEDYTNVRQGNAFTAAAAIRYTFDDPFADNDKSLHPYAEIGSWITPRAPLTMTRSYANGSGTSSGSGSTSATSWAEYGRGGLVWDVSSNDKLTGYGELGQQYRSFGGYSEDASAGNVFPATVGSGLLRMGVARAGGMWTHKLDDPFDQWRKVPVSITLAGAVAQSFNVHSGLTVNVSGVGSSTASNGIDTWGEFGGRITAGLYQNVDLNLDLSGTTGGGALGTTLHGGVGVSYKF